MSNTDPTKNRWWVRMLVNDTQFLLSYRTLALLLMYTVGSDKSIGSDKGKNTYVKSKIHDKGKITYVKSKIHDKGRIPT